MGVSSGPADDDLLLQLVLYLEVVNYFLCSHHHLKLEDFTRWKSYLFDFSKSMATLFDLEISTKLYRIMIKVSDHLIDLGFIRRGSSKENEIVQKDFKSL